MQLREKRTCFVVDSPVGTGDSLLGFFNGKMGSRDMRWLSSLLVMVVMVGSTSLWAAGGDLPGSGTEGDPYLIEDLADFDVFADSVNAATYWASGVYTKLACGPNLAGRTYTTAVIAPDTPDSTGGFDGTPFTGVFDGDGHVVSNITIDTAGASNDYLGLFGAIDGSSGEVKDLGMQNINITGGDTAALLGGLCGYNNGTISNCYAGVSVTERGGSWRLGGLVGENRGDVSNCYSTGDVEGRSAVGGLVGKNLGSVSDCYSTSDVSGNDVVGGLVGEDWGSISNCYSTGSVTVSGESRYVGGLVGQSHGSVSDCYSTSDVSGNHFVGGMVGDNSGSISNCYSTGDVEGQGAVGGLVGWNNDTITYSFWDTDTQTHGVTESIGVNEGTVTNVLGLPTAQMQIRITFADTDWDFTYESTNGTADIWRMCVDGVSYPQFAWEFAQRGDFACPDGVGLSDLAVFVEAWASGAGDANWNPGCDIRMDERIDLSDFGMFGENWQVDFSLVGHWTMNETEGSTASDSSIYGRDGTLLHMDDADWVEGNVGNALVFDGVDDYVEITGFTGLLGGQSRTVCAWIKTNVPGQVIIAWGPLGASGCRWVFGTNAVGQLWLGIGGGGSITGTVDVCDGDWHHVAVVAEDDGSPNINEVRLYVDGLPDLPSVNASDRTIDTLPGPDVTIGQYNGVSFLEGTIDDVRIYGRPLRADEIGDLANP